MLQGLGRRLIADLAARTTDTNANIFVSPVSIGMSLALLASGARGTTRAAILATLGLPNSTQEQLDHIFQQLGDQLLAIDPQYFGMLVNGALLDPSDQVVRVDIANGLWLNKDCSYEPAFVNHAREIYQAEVSGVDFESAETVAMINRWVSERTQGNIPQIVERIDPLTALILINAVYFKGPWSSPFNADRTKEAPFTLPGGSQITCDMMYQSETLPYVETETFQMVLMPFSGTRLAAHGEGVHLVVALPQLGKTCSDVLDTLGDRWKASLARKQLVFSGKQVDFWLPRFRITYEALLNDTLQALGIEVAFTDQANFGGITPSPTKISEVLHKTTFLVNERGAEASAATEVEYYLGVPENVTMRVDRPFVCGIVVNPDLSPIFLGVINQPERTEPA